MNKAEMLALKVGDEIERSILGNGHWQRSRITEIFAAGVTNNPRSTHHGKAYLCLYTENGPTSQISGSIREGESGYFRLSLAT